MNCEDEIPAGEAVVEVPGRAMAPQQPRVPARKRTRLSTIREVRAYLSRCARDLEAEDLASLRAGERTQVCRARIYAGQVLGGLIQATEMEARLAELERLIVTRGM